MKKYFRRLMSTSAFRRSLFGYALTILLVTVVILGTMFGVLAMDIREYGVDHSQQLLRQLVMTSERIKLEVDNLISTITTESNTQQFVQSKTDNKMNNFYLFLHLREVTGVYSYVADISVVNFSSGVTVHATGAEEGEPTALSEPIRQALKDGRQILVRAVTIAGKKQNVVSFLQYLPYNNSAIIVDVFTDGFGYSIGTASREVYVLDESGEAVTQNAREIVDGVTVAQRLTELRAGHTGQQVYDDSAGRRFYFFTYSEKLGWWFVDVQDYSQFYSNFTRAATVCLVVALLLLAMCVLISVLFSHKLQKPLRQLVNKCRATVGAEELHDEDELQFIDKAITRVEHERYQSEHYVQAQFLRNLMLGQEMPFFVSREITERFGKKFHSAFYCVLLIEIQPMKELSERERAEEYKIYRYTVCNLADEIFGEDFSCKTVETGEKTVAVLLMLEQETVSEKYVLCFRQLKEFVEKQVDISVNGSLGSVVDRQNEICLSFTKAKQYLEMSRLIGRDKLVDSNNASNSNYQEKNEKLVESIEEYAKLNLSDPGLSLKSLSQNFGLSTTYLGKIFKSIRGVSFSAYVTQCRLERSCAALRETNRTVSEIAEQVGFSNSTYFTTVFKNAYGVTPSAYRNKTKE
ncbi:MAG: helix-turn-helix transcriptional regulator [Firmicutes bacterium]|nr:helix-turn-helix transcriptional regulator [Bacillota bacterium]